jgi:DNA-binding MarR family transcriptional regulator
MKKEFVYRARREGLRTLTSLMLLDSLYEQGSASLVFFRDEAKISAAAISQIVASWRLKGLAERVAKPDHPDKRMQFICITEKGKSLIEEYRNGKAG